MFNRKSLFVIRNSFRQTQSGEIATLLTLISVGLMLMGVVVGNVAVKQTTRTQPFAQSTCTPGCILDENACTLSGGTADSTGTKAQECWYQYSNPSYIYCSCPVTVNPPTSAPIPTLPPPPPQIGCPSRYWSCPEAPVEISKCIGREGVHGPSNYGAADSSGKYTVGQIGYESKYDNPEKAWKWDAAGGSSCGGEEPKLKITIAPTSATSSCFPGTCGDFLTTLRGLDLETTNISMSKNLITDSGKNKVFENFEKCTSNIPMSNRELKIYCQIAAETPIPTPIPDPTKCHKCSVSGICTPGNIDATGDCYIGNKLTDDGIAGVCTPNICTPDTSSTTLAPPGTCERYVQDSKNTQVNCNIKLDAPNGCTPGGSWYECMPDQTCPYDSRVGVGRPYWCSPNGKTSFLINVFGECTWACPAPGQPTPVKDPKCNGLKDGDVIEGGKCQELHCAYGANTTETHWIEIVKGCKDGYSYSTTGKDTGVKCSLTQGTAKTANCVLPGSSLDDAKITPIIVTDTRTTPAPKNSPTDCQKVYQCPSSPNGNGKPVHQKGNLFFDNDQCSGTSKTNPKDLCQSTECVWRGGRCENSAASCNGNQPRGWTESLECPANKSICCVPNGGPVEPTKMPTSSTSNISIGANCTYETTNLSRPGQEIKNTDRFSIKVTNSSKPDASGVALQFHNSEIITFYKRNASVLANNSGWIFTMDPSDAKYYPTTAGTYNIRFGWGNCNDLGCESLASNDPQCTSVSLKIISSGTITSPTGTEVISTDCTQVPNNLIKDTCASCVDDGVLNSAAFNKKPSDVITGSSCNKTQKVLSWCKQNPGKCGNVINSCIGLGQCITSLNNQPGPDKSILSVMSYNNEGFTSFIEGVRKGYYSAIDASLYVLNASRVPGLQRLFCDPLLGQCDFYNTNPQVGT